MAGYVFATRYFNGEYHLFPKEIISFIAEISESMKSHQHFDDYESSMESVENCILEVSKFNLRSQEMK